jgi:hypothetical protein
MIFPDKLDCRNFPKSRPRLSRKWAWRVSRVSILSKLPPRQRREHKVAMPVEGEEVVVAVVEEVGVARGLRHVEVEVEVREEAVEGVIPMAVHAAT